ncbi:MAG TPA: LysR family transcriptional regulator [Burkholderiales bacterium]|nr:LysR family transcriptional regulator [Burkholderiales bacterium]
MLDIKSLAVFVQVYESGGIGRAATNLHTVQSAISARIQRLETELGVELFVRAARGVKATAEGDRLYEYATRVLALVEETESAVKWRKDVA